MDATCMMTLEMASPKEKSNTVSVQLRNSVRDEFSKFCRETGAIQADLLSKLITWYMAQDKTVRRLFLGELEASDAKTVAESVLRRIAAGDPVIPQDSDQRAVTNIDPEVIRRAAEAGADAMKRAMQSPPGEDKKPKARPA